MILRALLVFLLLLSCGRPLTENEQEFATSLYGDSLDVTRTRLVKGAPLGSVTFRRKPRPRLSCRERILPPSKEEIVTASPAAMTLFNKVLFNKDWYVDNYLPAYPKRLYLVEAMLLAHELTHVWQWQNREQTGYHPMRAAAEHSRREDPYLFELDGAPDFLNYGYEQQGAIVEEYVCCRSLAPKAARTKRLHQMLSDVFPVSDLPQTRPYDTYLPWKGAKVEGICD